MDAIHYIDYELIEPVSNQRFITESYEEARGYYEQEWIVIERQNTICQPSLFTESKLVVKMLWNNDPDFAGV